MDAENIQWDILQKIQELEVSSGPVDGDQIAKALSIDAPLVRGVLQRLKRKGYVILAESNGAPDEVAADVFLQDEGRLALLEHTVAASSQTPSSEVKASAPASSTVQPATQERLQELITIRDALYSRKDIHIRAIHHAQEQHAVFGLNTPFQVLEDIRRRQASIAEIDEQLKRINIEIDSLTEQPKVDSSNPTKPFILLGVKGRDYLVEAPYPFVYEMSETLDNGETKYKYVFAGGYEVLAVENPDRTLIVNFFRHGRYIIPEIDDAAQRVRLPLGDVFRAKSARFVNQQLLHSIVDLTQPQKEDSPWTIVFPVDVQLVTRSTVWPIGEAGAVTTTRYIYEASYQVVIVEAPNQLPAIWFYTPDANIAPRVSEAQHILYFPSPPLSEG